MQQLPHSYCRDAHQIYLRTTTPTSTRFQDSSLSGKYKIFLTKFTNVKFLRKLTSLLNIFLYAAQNFCRGPAVLIIEISVSYSKFSKASLSNSSSKRVCQSYRKIKPHCTMFTKRTYL